MASTALTPSDQGVSHKKLPNLGAGTEGVKFEYIDAAGLPCRQHNPEVQFASEPVEYRGST